MNEEGWHKKKELASPTWLKIARGLYRILGEKGCQLLLYPIALYFFIFAGEKRRASLDYLSRVYNVRTKPHGVSLYFKSYLHFLEFARNILDKLKGWHGMVKVPELEFEGREELRALVDKGQGVILLGAHLGNIEVIRAVSETMGKLKVTPLMFLENNPAFPNLLRSINPSWDLRVITTEEFIPELVVELQEKLANGEAVATLADRILPGSRDKKIACEFLGSSAYFPAGPLILASILAHPVFLTFCFKEKGGYRIVFEKFADKIELPRKERTERLQLYANKYVSRLEHYCRLYPLQWFNFYSFWH